MSETTEKPKLDSDTIAVLTTAMSFTVGWRASIQFFGDQPYGRIATNQGRKRGLIVADTFPELFRSLADLMEQQGLTNLEQLADYQQRVTEGQT